MNHKPIPLSQKGEQRRSQMLESLVDEMSRFHRRKRMRKIVGGSALAGLFATIAIGAWWFADAAKDQPLSDRGNPQPEHVSGDAPVEPNSGSKIVGSRPLLEKYCAKNEIHDVDPYVTQDVAGNFAKVEFLSDDELVSLYQKTGTDGFVAVINNQKVFLTNQNKADKKDDIGM